jgi:hypothetical protein
MNLNKIGKVFTGKFVRTGRGPRLIKRIYRAVVSQRLRNTGLEGALPYQPVDIPAEYGTGTGTRNANSIGNSF